jgi:hypothetical protein
MGWKRAHARPRSPHSDARSRLRQLNKVDLKHYQARSRFYSIKLMLLALPLLPAGLIAAQAVKMIHFEAGFGGNPSYAGAVQAEAILTCALMILFALWQVQAFSFLRYRYRPDDARKNYGYIQVGPRFIPVDVAQAPPDWDGSDVPDDLRQYQRLMDRANKPMRFDKALLNALNPMDMLKELGQAFAALFKCEPCGGRRKNARGKEDAKDLGAVLSGFDLHIREHAT